jgi:hypothetical protein
VVLGVPVEEGVGVGVGEGELLGVALGERVVVRVALALAPAWSGMVLGWVC